jgi:predicted small secreted protein
LDARLNQAIKGITTMVRKVIFSVALASLFVGLAACNTVKGAGRDIESVGKAGSDAIN